MRKYLIYFATVILLGVVFYNHDNNFVIASKKEANGYITQFYKERDSKTLKVGEEEVILEALEAYWQDDLKVAEILINQTKDLSIKSLVMSVKAEEKTEAIKIIESIFESANVEEQELLHDYVARHYLGTENIEVREFLTTLDDKKSSEYKNSSEYQTNSLPYNGRLAAAWAYNNYNVYSTNYPKFTGSFGTNCTNFVSQAMHVMGGLAKQGSWTITKKNTTYHEINSADQLNYSWSLTDPSPWISVKEFAQFWRSKSTIRAASKAQYINFPHNYRGQELGDIVIFQIGAAGAITLPTHAMIITQITTNDYNLAGNSVERQAHPLSTAIANYQYIEFYRPF